MSIITRFGALGALSILAACGTETVVVSASGDAADVTELMAVAAGMVTPDEVDSGEISEIFESEDGWQGFIGTEDGELKLLKLQIDREANTLTVTLGDDDPIVFTNTDPEGASANWYNEDSGYVYLYNYFSQAQFSGVFGYNWLEQSTAAEDLPESGQVGYAGEFYLEGESGDAWGDIALAVDFGSGEVTGGIVGSMYNDYCCEEREIFFIEEEGPISEGPEGDSFFGTLGGSVEGNILAASGDVDGTVSGSVGMLGTFTYGGDAIGGGIVGNIGGNKMGGEFDLYVGGYD